MSYTSKEIKNIVAEILENKKDWITECSGKMILRHILRSLKNLNR